MVRVNDKVCEHYFGNFIQKF